jgi:hypothetical protein
MGSTRHIPVTNPDDESALAARLLALGHASIEVAALCERGTEGMTLAERLERLLGRPDDGEARQGRGPR